MKTLSRMTFACLLVAGAGRLGAQPQNAAPNPNRTNVPTSAEVAAAPAPEDKTVVLSPFEVTADKDHGYQATETLAGTRIRTDLKDVGSAITVVTKEFMKDIDATNINSLLQYTPNAEVSGTLGTYAGLGNGTTVDETNSLRNPSNVNRVRGLSAPDVTRDFFVTDIPFDSFNVDRIDIQRGPNSILFGLGSPAGIVNASTHNAEFHNNGSVEYRTGSYGSNRGSVDINQVLIPKVLAIRIDALTDQQKYQQKPAYQDDKRLYISGRFDPQLFKDPSFHTSLKVKYENGDITANRPRIVPPNDSITPWFKPVDNTSLNGGLGKLSVNNAYEVGAAPQNINPWLSSSVANQQQPIWFIDGTTNQTYRIYGGYVNNGARLADGTPASGNSQQLLGRRYADEFYGLTSLSTFANNARLPGYQYGQYRQASLLDPSVFDFYNNLIDGPTKSEYENWNAYNIDLTQTAFDDRLGVELSYDRQKYKRGGQALINNPTLTIDVLKNFQDLSPNPNYGRPYIAGGPGSGSSYESDRKYTRASIFGEVRSTDFFDKNSLIAKLLGRHRFNGVYSDESYATENRSWQMYANSLAWNAYFNQTDGNSWSFKDRAPVSAIYLGSSLANSSTAAGAYIPGITAPVALQDGSIYHFNTTWTNPPGVAYTAPWTVPAALLPIYDPTVATTQVSNPANYVGWNSNFQDNLQRYNNGQDLSLLTNAQKSLRKTKSYAGSWQGFFWNDAIVATLGWRYDEVKGKSVTALPVTLNRAMLNLQPNVYTLPDAFPANQIFKDHSTSGGLVVHLNKLLGERDPLPVDVSLTYNKSSNFQVTDTRRDVFGNPIGNPTGKTKDYGVLLSTKDGKFSLRAIKYESSVAGASTQLDLTGLANTITQGIKFRNVFLYRLSGYTWDTREQTNLSPGQRYYWTPAYINSTGRPVADLDGNPAPVPAGATLESQSQGDAHRDASINAWNAIQKWLEGKGFFKAWGYTPTTTSALTDRATYEAALGPVGADGKPTTAPQYMPDISTLASYTAIAPSGLAVTADTQSEGYEFELTANPTPNWRLAFNASETSAVRSNVGGPELDSLVAYMDQQMAGVAGDLRQFNGNYVGSNEIRQNWANWRGQYTLLKLQEGAAASELRKWRFNLVTNYTFREDFLKGVGIGGAYRWQDKVVIGYPVIPGANGQASFDLSQPYYGPTEGAADFWISYERMLTKKIGWQIQLNIRNAFDKEGLIPISVEPDGKTWASVRTQPVREWSVTNTFTF